MIPEKILKLSPEEKLQLVTELWDHLAQMHSNDLRLSPEQEKELLDRLAEHDRDPEGGLSWEEVKKAQGWDD